MADFRENQQKIDRGIAIEKVWEDLEEWFEKQKESRKSTLVHTDFEDMSDVKQTQEHIRALDNLENQLDSWITKKDKLLQKRRDNNQ